jgi:hypothetical protein
MFSVTLGCPLVELPPSHTTTLEDGTHVHVDIGILWDPSIMGQAVSQVLGKVKTLTDTIFCQVLDVSYVVFPSVPHKIIFTPSGIYINVHFAPDLLDLELYLSMVFILSRHTSTDFVALACKYFDQFMTTNASEDQEASKHRGTHAVQPL